MLYVISFDCDRGDLKYAVYLFHVSVVSMSLSRLPQFSSEQICRRIERHHPYSSLKDVDKWMSKSICDVFGEIFPTLNSSLQSNVPKTLHLNIPSLTRTLKDSIDAIDSSPWLTIKGPVQTHRLIEHFLVKKGIATTFVPTDIDEIHVITQAHRAYLHFTLEGSYQYVFSTDMSDMWPYTQRVDDSSQDLYRALRIYRITEMSNKFKSYDGSSRCPNGYREYALRLINMYLLTLQKRSEKVYDVSSSSSSTEVSGSPSVLHGKNRESGDKAADDSGGKSVDLAEEKQPVVSEAYESLSSKRPKKANRSPSKSRNNSSSITNDDDCDDDDDSIRKEREKTSSKETNVSSLVKRGRLSASRNSTRMIQKRRKISKLSLDVYRKTISRLEESVEYLKQFDVDKYFQRKYEAVENDYRVMVEKYNSLTSSHVILQNKYNTLVEKQKRKEKLVKRLSREFLGIDNSDDDKDKV